MGLKLQKKMLEKQLAEVQKKVQTFQHGSSRNIRLRTSSSRQTASRSTETSSFSFPELGCNKPAANAGLLTLDVLNKQQLKYRRKYGSVPRDICTKQISAASGVRSSKVSQQLHQRNTELLTRRRNKVKNAGKLPKLLAAPKSGAFKRHSIPPSLFPTAYKRGELPCRIEHRAGKSTQIIMS